MDIVLRNDDDELQKINVFLKKHTLGRRALNEEGHLFQGVEEGRVVLAVDAY